MTSLKRITLAATLLGTLAAPAFAQTAPSATTPDTTAPTQAEPATPVPDTGMKKTTETPKPHHRVHHHAHAKPAPDTTPPTAR